MTMILMMFYLLIITSNYGDAKLKLHTMITKLSKKYSQPFSNYHRKPQKAKNSFKSSNIIENSEAKKAKKSSKYFSFMRVALLTTYESRLRAVSKNNGHEIAK